MECVICHRSIDEASIILWEQAICPLCEGVIVSLKPDDDGYDEIAAALRAVWQDYSPVRSSHHLLTKDEGT
ncbi:MAG: hypothetical protein GX331_08850 [Firmicutes bacterium]|jgi:hypothetical protein|nr:hypothetical protein [Bacillota bacterium]